MKVAPRLVIPDASVLIKWALFKEKDRVLALTLREDFLNRKIDLWVPQHCFYELGNTLGRKWPSQVTQFLSQLLMSRLVSCSLTVESVALTLDLMQRYSKVTFYDASYHALALLHQGTFVTADEAYFKIMHNEGAIQLLRDYV